MARAIRGTHEYEYTTEGSQQFVKDGNGHTDFTKRVVPVRSKAQVESYKERLEREKSEIVQDVIRINKAHDGDTEAYFVFMFYTPVTKFLEDHPNMNKGDYARLVYLSTFLRRNDSRIRFNSRRSAKRSDIKEILNVSDSTAKRFIRRALDDGVIEFNGYNVLHLNTSILKNGDAGAKTKTRHYAKLMIQNTRFLYHKFNKGKSIERLGILYSLVPYIDYKYNVLCRNANTQIDNMAQIDPLTVQDVTNILGFKSIRKTKDSLFNIKIPIADGLKEISIIAITSTGDDERALITVNPLFIYRNDITRIGKIDSHMIFIAEWKEYKDWIIGEMTHSLDLNNDPNALTVDLFQKYLEDIEKEEAE